MQPVCVESGDEGERWVNLDHVTDAVLTFRRKGEAEAMPVLRALMLAPGRDGTPHVIELQGEAAIRLRDGIRRAAKIWLGDERPDTIPIPMVADMASGDPRDLPGEYTGTDD